LEATQYLENAYIRHRILVERYAKGLFKELKPILVNMRKKLLTKIPEATTSFKILIVTQYFWPENFKINELALWLKGRGHEVTVLTGQPNYPEGYFYDNYYFNYPNYQDWQGISIYRMPTIPRGRGKGVRLILNYIFFPFITSFLGYKRIRKKEFDLIFVCQLSPIFVALPAIRIKKKKRIPIAMWILDIWPDSVFAVSKFNGLLIKSILNVIVKYIYNNTDHLFISSRSFSKSILSYNISINKITYFPNWSEHTIVLTDKNENLNDLPTLPIGFNILFAGNIGEAQDIETIINAAVLIKREKNIKWIFVGDGRKRTFLQQEIKKNQLEETVFWFGRFPAQKMSYFYNKSSALIVSLKKSPVFMLTVPARLQTCMSYKKTIISLLSGEGNDIVTKANCGIAIESGDFKTLAQVVVELSNLSQDELLKYGENGYNYFMENFEKEKLLKNIENELEIIANTD